MFGRRLGDSVFDGAGFFHRLYGLLGVALVLDDPLRPILVQYHFSTVTPTYQQIPQQHHDRDFADCGNVDGSLLFDIILVKILHHRVSILLAGHSSTINSPSR